MSHPLTLDRHPGSPSATSASGAPRKKARPPPIITGARSMGHLVEQPFLEALPGDSAAGHRDRAVTRDCLCLLDRRSDPVGDEEEGGAGCAST